MTDSYPDIPISELPVASEAADGDYFVINKGNVETRRINFKDISSVETYTGFAPIFVRWETVSRTDLMLQPGDTYVPAGNPYNQTAVVGEDELISKVISPKNGGGVGPDPGEISSAYTRKCQFTLPEGADSCIVIMNHTTVAASGTKPVPNSTSYHFGKGTQRERFTVTNGTFNPSNGNGKLNKSLVFNSTWSRGTEIGRHHNSNAIAKYMNIQDVTGPVTINGEGLFQDCLKYYYWIGPANSIVLPFSDTLATQLGYKNALMQLTAGEMAWEDEIGPMDPELYASAMQQSSKNILCEAIQAIHTSMVAGTRQDGSPWTDDQVAAMEESMKEMYRLRYTYSGTTSGLEDEIDKIFGDCITLVPELRFFFDLSDAPGNSSFLSVF